MAIVLNQTPAWFLEIAFIREVCVCVCVCALSKLRPRKAGGDSGVLLEMLVFGGPVLHTVLLDLFQRVWREDQVFAAWRDALVVPVPKKGDLTMCDNWRGISLLDVAGKLLGRIFQE